MPPNSSETSRNGLSKFALHVFLSLHVSTIYVLFLVNEHCLFSTLLFIYSLATKLGSLLILFLCPFCHDVHSRQNIQR